MKLSDFDFELPEAQIAQEPLPERDASRLLVLHRKSGRREHRLFPDLLEYLRSGDLLVVNDAKVVPARLLGRKVDTGGRVELLLSMPLAAPESSFWRCIGRASKAIRAGARLSFTGLEAEVKAVHPGGAYDVQFFTDDLPGDLTRAGNIPLPPYIRRPPSEKDRERYQTIFASRPGAAAAPTAGFHFTEPILAKVAEMGVALARVTLYVGAGTFLPVRSEAVEEHRMHAERYEVTAEAAALVERTRAAGGRVFAVGTTAARTLESAAEGGRVCAGEGISELFIYPGFKFQIVDALVTNFHLPKSTLLLLVSAFAGREQVLSAYGEAVRMGYRFFSYGDAMLLL
jgi:S-adenosylmethionine:tRNA ribosyltransferase-isomerase